MVRRIGNLFFIFCTVTSLFCFGNTVNIDLRVLNEQGNKITKTGVTIPTILEVIVHGVANQAEKLFIDGLQDFEVQQHGTTKQLSTINGVTSTKIIYRYIIRTQKEGKYTIGPAHVQIGNSVHTSEAVVLDVQRNLAVSDQKIALEIIADKKNVVVGEEIPIRIRFYTAKGHELLGIDPLELQQCKMSAMKSPVTGVAERNGVQQKYIEWQTVLVPQRAGELMLAGLKAHYKEPTGRGLQASFFGGLFDFGYTQKTVYSNAVSIAVDSLPEFDGTVHAVGSFSALRAHLNQQEAKEGEGVVLTLELEGKGNLDGIIHPTLQLPEAFTYYDSKAVVAPSGNKKTFEYIVQGKQEGVGEIPSQEFIFYDVHEKRYKILQTNSLPLSIVPGIKSTKNEETPKIEGQEKAQQNIWLPNENNHASIPNQAGLPASILWAGLMLPLLLGVMRISTFLMHWYTSRDSVALRRKQAYTEAKRNIKNATKKHDATQLYDIFVTFLSCWYDLKPAEVSPEVIRIKLDRFSESTILQWEKFFTQITEQAYANRNLTLQEEEKLFKTALMWLTLFNKSEQL